MSWPENFIEIPNLDASLAWMHANNRRIEVNYSWDGELEYSGLWDQIYRDMSISLLVAKLTIEQIDKGLQLLLWPIEPSTKNLLELGDSIDFSPTELLLLTRALALVDMSNNVLGDWEVDKYHVYAVNNMDQVTIDEWDDNVPELPNIDGLPDWNDIDEIEEDGYLFDGNVLVDACKQTLLDLINLIEVRNIASNDLNG